MLHHSVLPYLEKYSTIVLYTPFYVIKLRYSALYWLYYIMVHHTTLCYIVLHVVALGCILLPLQPCFLMLYNRQEILISSQPGYDRFCIGGFKVRALPALVAPRLS